MAATENRKRRKAERRQTKSHLTNHPNCVECGKGPTTFTVTRGSGEQYQSIAKNEVHHLVPIKDGGSHKDGLVTLCGICHNAIHTVNGVFNYRHINPELTMKYLNLLTQPTSGIY